MQISSGRLRTAQAEDGAQLLRLWAFLFDEDGTTSEEPWNGSHGMSTTLAMPGSL
jgi:hypothetical protein